MRFSVGAPLLTILALLASQVTADTERMYCDYGTADGGLCGNRHSYCVSLSCAHFLSFHGFERAVGAANGTGGEW
jgi:hypothetical protein